MSCSKKQMIIEYDDDEDYDSDMDDKKPVCDNQSHFNVAFRKALKYNEKKNNKPNTYTTIAAIIWIIFFVWALVLAMKEPATINIMFAILFSPVYVLSYYLKDFNGQMGQMGQMGFNRGASRMSCS